MTPNSSESKDPVALPLKNSATYFKHLWNATTPINQGMITLSGDSLTYVSGNGNTNIKIPTAEIEKVRMGANMKVITKKESPYFGMISLKENFNASLPAVGLGGSAAGRAAGSAGSFVILKKYEKEHHLDDWNKAFKAMNIRVESENFWMFKVFLACGAVILIVAILMQQLVKK